VPAAPAGASLGVPTMSEPVLQLEPQRAASLVAVDGRSYPLESAHLTARAEGGLAMSTLAQTYLNPHDEPLEVLYTLPLPADGAVLGYTVRIGEKLIHAEVQPRERATEEYRKALYEGRTAGLLEESRPDTFQQRLGNVPPRTKVEIAIDVLHPLAFVHSEPGATAGATPAPEAGATANRWEYRFPTVVGVRYQGALARPEDERGWEATSGRSREGMERMILNFVRYHAWHFPLPGPGAEG